MDPPLQGTSRLDGCLNVFCLGDLLATSEEDNEGVPLSCEIDPITWAIVDPQFRDTLSHWLHIAREAERKAEKLSLYPSICLCIVKVIKPF